MSGDFEDIEIVDLDVARTTWSRVHSSMRTVYLKLSREPDVYWTRHFFEERGRRINPRRHGLWIEDGYIVIDCFLGEVESHQLPDIRLSVAYANLKGHEQDGQRREQSLQAREDKHAEEEELAALRERIRRSAPPGEETPAPAAAEESAAPAAAGTIDAELARKRDEWQARFRAARASRGKEHGHDD